jgi:hypothetical protein
MFLYERNLDPGVDAFGAPQPDVNRSLPGTGSPIVVVGLPQIHNNFFQWWYNQATTTYGQVTPSTASIVVTNTGATTILVNNTSVAPGATYSTTLTDAGYGNGDQSTWLEGTFLRIACTPATCCSGYDTSMSQLYSRVAGGGGSDERLLLDWDSTIESWLGAATETNGARVAALVWCRGETDDDYHVSFGGRKPGTGSAITNSQEYSAKASGVVCEPLCISSGVGASSVLARNPSDTNPTACCANEIPTPLFATLTASGCITCTSTIEISYYCNVTSWHLIGSGALETGFCGTVYFWRVNLTCVAGAWSMFLTLRNNSTGASCYGATTTPTLVSCSPLHLTQSFHLVSNPCCPGLGGNLDLVIHIVE